jgi:hypothetical protein
LKKNLVNLFKFSHDRKIHYLPAVNELFKVIEDFSSQKELNPVVQHFISRYDLPEDVIKQKIKLGVAKSYVYRDAKFDDKLSLYSMPKSMLAYGALIYAFFFIKKDKKITKYKLIIDDVCDLVELERFKKLINLIGKKNTLVVLRNFEIQDDTGYNFYNKKLFRGFDKNELCDSIYKEFFSGFWIVFVASLKTKINLFPLTLEIIHSFLSFKSLFDSNKADFILQERHYNTNAVKNYLFKKMGGVSSATIQKNIIEADLMFAFMDIDILFSLGNSGFGRLFDYGAKIDTVHPVGSFFMEYYWFDKDFKIENNFDILFLGINVTNGESRIDKYTKWNEDYYTSFKWLVKIKKYNPKLRIAIKHHASAGIEDPVELSILKNSGIIIADKKLNSYQLAFSSKCVLTYGSTMGYELAAHGVHSLFVDPNFRCAFLPEIENDNLGKNRISSYDDFKKAVDCILNGNGNDYLPTLTKFDLCRESTETSKNIVDYLKVNY